MAKAKDEYAEDSPVSGHSIDSSAREGNDVSALVGSGAPMRTVRANAGCMGLRYGEVTTLVQTEELRLNLQNGNLSLVED